ncbi:B3 domain-containing protein REM16-like isoform X2 [Euphorbia lathyris]|uniref:B3 domain-containing protein REM16-like isoform X2 n=1 Tax=Euphorbia lathyris TaxID=212925 RepID=UPI00331375B4
MVSSSKNNNLFKEDQRPHFFKFILADSVHEHKYLNMIRVPLNSMSSYILDNTATEIEYPFTFGANVDEQQFQERKIEVVESENDVSAEILPSNANDQAEVIQRENKTSSTNKKLIKEEKKKVIPSRFAKKYINKEVANIILNSVDQRTWSVDYVEIKIGGLKVARLCRGWRKFVEDNHLKVGDVCIFELINHNATTTFKVVISRENQDAKTVCQC